MNKDIHNIYETYTQMSQMDLPVLHIEISSSRGERYEMYASKAIMKTVKEYFYNPEQIDYFRAFTREFPTWEECLKIIGNGDVVVINGEESSTILGINKKKLLKLLAVFQQDEESITDKEIDEEIKMVTKLPNVENEWKMWKDRQIALQSTEHGTDLTF